MCKLLDGICYRRVLAIGAHPDDVEVGAGGFLARLARRGANVTIAIASVPGQVEARLAEAKAAAALLGCAVTVLTGEQAMRVEDLPMHRLVALLDEVVAAVKPDLVLTHSIKDVHWDHRLVHGATVSALRRTPCDLFAFTSTPELNATSHFLGECFADITDSLEVKLAAVQAHQTQVPKSVDLESCRDLARALGRLSGVQYAEAFQVLRLTF